MSPLEKTTSLKFTVCGSKANKYIPIPKHFAQNITTAAVLSIQEKVPQVPYLEMVFPRIRKKEPWKDEALRGQQSFGVFQKIMPLLMLLTGQN